MGHERELISAADGGAGVRRNTSPEESARIGQYPTHSPEGKAV